LSASGPSTGVVGKSGLLKMLFFGSAIDEPHEFLDQVFHFFNRRSLA
jgi:hypothetical protein